MAELKWDATGKRFFETGVDHGVLYLPNAQGEYDKGYVWNGLVTVTESPSGAEANPQYADNIKYLNLVSAEEFSGTIEAFTYPEEFGECDGTAMPTAGVSIGQQTRKPFGLSYRTRVGNDLAGTDYGYKLHFVYNALAAPTEKAFSTINDSPEAIQFSWEFSTTPVEVPGFKPSATITVDSSKVPADKLAALEAIVYGSATTEARLPFPAEIFELLADDRTPVAPTVPGFNAATNTITVPTTTGIDYQIAGVTVTGTRVINSDTTVTAVPKTGYRLESGAPSEWLYEYTP